MSKSKKIIGYILCLAGLAGLAITYEPISKALSLTLPEALNTTNLTIISVVLLIIGVLFLYKKGSGKKSKQEPEVPIYKGNEVVGYRRH